MNKASNTDSAEATYDAARAKLADLIDNPEKHLPISEYQAHIRAAQRASAAAHKAMLTARRG